MRDYEDIINHPHYVSKKRPQMSRSDRAAQFSPFAALVGHEEALAAKEQQINDLFADEGIINHE